MHYKLKKKNLEYNITKIYSRIPATRTLKESETQLELAGNSSYPSPSYRGSTVKAIFKIIR